MLKQTRHHSDGIVLRGGEAAGGGRGFPLGSCLMKNSLEVPIHQIFSHLRPTKCGSGRCFSRAGESSSSSRRESIIEKEIKRGRGHPPVLVLVLLSLWATESQGGDTLAHIGIVRKNQEAAELRNNQNWELRHG